MRALSIRVAVATVLTAQILSASERARSFSLAWPGGSARAHVPKIYAPVLPGSVYPDRKKPVAARACPVAVVEGSPGFARALREPLLERGFLVVETGRVGSLAGVLESLRAHSEADPSRLVFIGRQAPEHPPGVRLAAVALFDPGPEPAGAEAPPAATVAVFLTTPSHVPSAAVTRQLKERFGPQTVEKWYRAQEGFPGEAFRDAAEWAAAGIPRIR